MGSGGTQFDTQDVLSVDRLNQKMFYVGSVCPVTTYVGMIWQDTNYDPPVMRQRNAANSGWDILTPNALMSQYISYSTDFLFTPTTTLFVDPFTSAAIGSGTVSIPTVVANHMGTERFNGSASNPTGISFFGGAAQMFLEGGEVFECVFSIPTTTSNYVNMGFQTLTNTAALPTYGVFFNINATTCKAYSIGAGTTNDGTGYTVSASTWYHARITVNSNATSVLYQLYTCSNGTLVYSYTITTNLPTSASYPFTVGVMGVSTAASGTPTILDLDFIGFYIPVVTTSTSGTMSAPPR